MGLPPFSGAAKNVSSKEELHIIDFHRQYINIDCEQRWVREDFLPREAVEVVCSQPSKGPVALHPTASLLVD